MMLVAALLSGSLGSAADHAVRFGGPVQDVLATAREAHVESVAGKPVATSSAASLEVSPHKHNGPHGTYYTHSVVANLPDLLGDHRQYVWNPNPRHSGQCATGVEFLAGSRDRKNRWHDIPRARNNGWTKGEAVIGNPGVMPGTVIARGWAADGHYPNKPAGNHAAIYLGQSKDGSQISVYDQYAGKALSISSWPGASDWAVVTTKQGADPRPSDSALRPWPPKQ